MYSGLPSFILGYHGCDAAVAEALFAGQEKHLKQSQNAYDWLGSGVYFWESGVSRALEYATLRMNYPAKKEARISRPAVVGAVIDLGNCLNLLDSKFLGMMRDGFKRLSDTLQDSGVPMPQNSPLKQSNELLLRNLDCAVINMVHEMLDSEGHAPFDTVRAAFIEGEPIYAGSSFHEKNHIQICVRNLSCIKGYFRPFADGDEMAPAEQHGA